VNGRFFKEDFIPSEETAESKSGLITYQGSAFFNVLPLIFFSELNFEKKV